MVISSDDEKEEKHFADGKSSPLNTSSTLLNGPSELKTEPNQTGLLIKKKSWKISELHLERVFPYRTLGWFTFTQSPLVPLLNGVFVTYVTDPELILQQAKYRQHTARVIKSSKRSDPSHKHTETTSVHRGFSETPGTSFLPTTLYGTVSTIFSF